MSKVLIVIFCYNVEENIRFILKKIKKNKLNNKRDILFIDDCSTDKTNKILKSYKITNSKIIKNKHNQGFGLNYKFSIKYAIKKKYKKLIFLHGDNQYPANKIPDVDKKLDISSLCYGSRKLNFKSMKKNMPKTRFIANIILTFFINFMLKNNATEYFSGFRGIRVDKLKEIKLNDFANKWIIEQQIHFYFIIKKYKVTEIPIPTVYKENQISKLPPFNYVFSVLISTFRFSFLKNFF
tara:strand:+ start:170 stop:883 length:714 start_codon:yes stop_codon:yes gene_type:complete